jgi:hypothetical protein
VLESVWPVADLDGNVVVQSETGRAQSAASDVSSRVIKKLHVLWREETLDARLSLPCLCLACHC